VIDLILIGGGGHCKSCIEVIRSTHKYNIKGVLDIKENIGQKILEIDIIGDDEMIQELISKNYHFVVTIGHIKDCSLRKKLYDLIKKENGVVETIIASTAIVSKYAQIGEGTIIMHNAIVNASVVIGNNCIINSSALIEHDTIINDHTHVSTMAAINGGCKIGEGCFVGSNSVLNQGIEIVDNVIIGAGSVVNKHITERGTFLGNPFRKY